jgi:hypothetical protein
LSEVVIKLRVLFGLVTFGFSWSSHCIAQTAPASRGVVETPNGSSLALGDSCYVFQSLKSERIDGVDVLAVVVHQHLLSGKFDMRDSLLLRKADLLPIRLDTDRDGSPHVHLDYSQNRVTGWKMVNGSKQPINVPLDGPVWDGNLWGVTFAALPLKEGATYRLPTYQYDNGKGEFFLTVAGQQKAATDKGTVDAWVVEAGLKPDERVQYLIGQRPPKELGYAAGPMSQHLGGDCTELH